MGWFSNLFFSSNGSSLTARRKMAMSTHDAFSLPTSSPVQPTHPHESLSRYGSSTPDPEPSSQTPSYAYPPPSTNNSPTSYDYIPSFARNSRSRPTSLLPLHSNTPLSPLPPYPQLTRTWARIRNWLAKEYPELEDTLNWGILPEDLADVEVALGTNLPQPVRDSYLAINGQEAESAAGCSDGLFFGLTLLPLEDVVEEWRFWREVDDDPATGANPRLCEMMQSIPPGWIRQAYSQRGWIPLVSDKAGNYLGVDLAPGERGSAGQVIIFGRDFDTKVVLWKGDGPGGWATWLANFADDLENGEGFELGTTSDGSEGSEDSVGYESYFFDGTARAKGEGGADAGAVGLRLTGEYKGWSVLEALADRSVKRWREAGVLPDVPSPPQNDGANLGLGVLDFTTGEGTSSINEQEPATPTASSSRADTVVDDSSTTTSSTRTRPQVPTISVTKAHAPQPVPLPSPHDLEFSSPPTSRGTSFDRDLELGRQTSLDEDERPLSEGPSTPVVSALPNGPSKKVLREVLASDSGVAIAPSVEASPILVDSSTPAPPPPDLLHTDSLDGVPITPLKPQTPTTESSPLPTEQVNGVNESKSDSKTSSSVASADNDDAIPSNSESEPEPTIRLVGGNATAEVVAEPESIPQTPEATNSEQTRESTKRSSKDADTASITSVGTTKTTRDSVDKVSSSPKSKHEKKKSFSSGLKRISILGGGGSNKRRVDKEAIP